MEEDLTPDSWDAIEDPGAESSENISSGFQSLNVNAKPFVPNVNAPVFVPSFTMNTNTKGKELCTSVVFVGVYISLCPFSIL